MAVLTSPRLPSLHLAQGQWQARGDSWRAYIGLCQLNIMEPDERNNVCFSRRRLRGAHVSILPIYHPKIPLRKLQLDRRKQPPSPNRCPKPKAGRIIQWIPTNKRIENHINILISIDNRESAQAQQNCFFISMLLLTGVSVTFSAGVLNFTGNSTVRQSIILGAFEDGKPVCFPLFFLIFVQTHTRLPP